MRDLRPTGIPVMLDGVKRYFLFTLNVIDEIQSHYDATMMDALGKMLDERGQFQAVRYFVQVLLNDETERVKWKDPDADIKGYSDKEIGWLITADNIGEITAAILAAYHVSIPDPEDDDPNQESGQQNN